MIVTAARTHATAPANPDWFPGGAEIAILHPPTDPSNLTAFQVTFAPGSRTAWHTHPMGQLLVITAGTAEVQVLGGPVTTLYPGDTVWFPPGEKHWHGAAAGGPMTHIAVQERHDGRTVDWMEAVD
jgi:quercetin dioxygenase-like cupin family protein